ncbi:hypothetical protein NDN01_07040 [Sphingomonas sp. QA11]|uniref:hypothetical protein n=1 Tax=Sphingomonas sp. QA11 TaxID=2950605 RepID=UPI002349BD1C|nr:hypothetical protein [Sphingomonas sp. QA11]WCM28661.1 hypothetical protein NDN01_07040 [Sphingomonas sp. QA11]
MPWFLIIVLSFHVLSSVFWAGTTFVLARNGGVGAARLFRPQMGAAIVATVSGAILWHLTHADGWGYPEKVLSLGIAAALLALAVQAIGAGRALRAAGSPDAATPASLAPIYRVSAGLLMVTVVCMAVARYV